MSDHDRALWADDGDRPDRPRCLYCDDLGCGRCHDDPGNPIWQRYTVEEWAALPESSRELERLIDLMEMQ